MKHNDSALAEVRTATVGSFSRLDILAREWRWSRCCC
jgi:hypothetical protein